jgi:hypothetical protein
MRYGLYDLARQLPQDRFFARNFARKTCDAPAHILLSYLAMPWARKQTSTGLHKEERLYHEEISCHEEITFIFACSVFIG